LDHDGWIQAAIVIGGSVLLVTLLIWTGLTGLQ
jgi:hypothetical protein